MNKLLIATSLLGLLVYQTPIEASVTTATYYSNYYNGRTMANGKKFSQHNLTAAHPSLRLGTKIKVFNPKNKRSVVVTITDRCRCTLDLSKSAFKRIAPLKRGRVRVYIRKL